MSAKDRRLDRLAEGLTARERVVLIQMAVFEDREPDPSIWKTIPSEQSSEIRRLGALAGQSHLVLTTHIAWLHSVVEALELRWLLLMSHVGWALDRSSILLSASLVTHVPITETDYEARRAELSADLLGVNDAAELVLATESDDSPRSVRRAEKEVRAAIKSGDLKAERNGRSYQMTYGAFCDWRGETVEPFPDWGHRYDVVPDDAVHFGDSAAWLQTASESDPHHPARALPALAADSNWPVPNDLQSLHGRLMVGLARYIAHELPRREVDLAALTEAVDMVSAEFRDEAIVADINRGMLDGVRAILASLRESAPPVVGEIDETPPHEALTAELRRQMFDSEA